MYLNKQHKTNGSNFNSVKVATTAEGAAYVANETLQPFKRVLADMTDKKAFEHGDYVYMLEQAPIT